MLGLNILQRSLSVAAVKDKAGQRWQYHPRSDHHSKVACWAIVFDLLSHSAAIRAHVDAGKISFGINHEMRDFENDRKKNLDLVVCTPAPGATPKKSLAEMAMDYDIQLDPAERRLLDDLPEFRSTAVGSVLMALEAKACMTAHQRALPRLYDELNSSHLTVHGATDQAIAVGFAMVNLATEYLSPELNKLMGAPRVWSRHNQPRDAILAIDKIRQLKRRSKPGV